MKVERKPDPNNQNMVVVDIVPETDADQYVVQLLARAQVENSQLKALLKEMD